MSGKFCRKQKVLVSCVFLVNAVTFHTTIAEHLWKGCSTMFIPHIFHNQGFQHYWSVNAHPY